MKTLVIVSHPNLTSSRINHAWVEALQQQDDITVHALYDHYSNNPIDIIHEQKILEAHNRIIFQYPLYWYSSPSLLKEWFDTVLQYGWAHGPGGDKMKGKEIGAAISTYGSAETYQLNGFNRFTIREILRPVEALTHYISAAYLPPFTLHDSSNVTEAQLNQSKIDYIQHIRTASPTSALLSQT